MTDLKRIDHVGIVVEDIEEALPFWRDALGLPLDQVKTVESQGVRIAFLPVGESEVELLQPLKEDSGVARFLRKRGPGMHHLCFEVKDVERKLRRLQQEGVERSDEQPEVI